MQRTRIRIAILGFASAATILLWWLFLSSPRQDPKKIFATQDSVYEAVVRDIVAPVRGPTQTTELVFSQQLLTPWGTEGADPKSCTAEVERRPYLHAHVSRPPFDSVADKVYRLITRGGDDYSIQADTVRDFAEKYCAGGRLSESFHTDLPRTFIVASNVYFEIAPNQKRGAMRFAQLFPGAGGIISFSRVGFDPTLDEAILASSFVCGALCGTGKIYVVRKRFGHWRVVNQWIVWVS
jgi:hypothetical protein